MSRWLDLAQQQIGKGTSGPCANSAIIANSPENGISVGVPLVPIVPKGQNWEAIGTIGTVTEIDADPAERQALLEVDGYVSPVFCLAFAAFQMGCQPRRRVEDWLRAVDDAGRFLECHGSQAALLGWTAKALFSADGLAWVLKGATVTDLTRTTARLSDGRTFRREGEA